MREYDELTILVAKALNGPERISNDASEENRLWKLRAATWTVTPANRRERMLKVAAEIVDMVRAKIKPDAGAV